MKVEGGLGDGFLKKGIGKGRERKLSGGGG
jgi:hypothetical protein